MHSTILELLNSGKPNLGSTGENDPAINPLDGQF